MIGDDRDRNGNGDRNGDGDGLPVCVAGLAEVERSVPLRFGHGDHRVHRGLREEDREKGEEKETL